MTKPVIVLFQVMHQKYWNWIQLAFSILVVFYATGMLLERAYRSIKTWNPNMFTLISMGAGLAWLFSVAGMFSGCFPGSIQV